MRNEKAWESFLAGLRGEKEKPEAGPAVPDSENPGISIAAVEDALYAPAKPVSSGDLDGRLLLVLAVITWAIWKAVSKPAPLPVASIARMTYPLPDKPSIAVLAFTNMSGDPKDDLFGDGLAEGIINGLSKGEHIFVIARKSTSPSKANL